MPPSGQEKKKEPFVPPNLESTIVLLMPDQEIGPRVDVDSLVSLSQSISEVVGRLHERHEIDAVPMTIFVAVKPGGKIKTWAEGIDAPLSPADAALLEAQTSAATAPRVTGSIALAFAYPSESKPLQGIPPVPRAWRDAAAEAGKALQIPDGLLAAVWPD